MTTFLQYASIGVVAAVLCACFQDHEPSSPESDSAAALKDFNLVIIVSDALRPDHLGCYGYRRDTSPFIDTLAANGLRFENALSNSTLTAESISSLFSGLLPSSGGGIGWLACPSNRTLNLAELYRNAGYRTGFFVNTAALMRDAFTLGFDEFEHMATAWNDTESGMALTERALGFVENCGKRKFLMYMHYINPHAPYDPPDDLHRRFVDKPFAKPLKLYHEVTGGISRLVNQGFGPGDPRFEDLVERYDAEIADTDRSIRLLFEGLRKFGVDKRTLVIFTADHAEEFLEHGYVDHAWTLYQEVLHIPLILWAPGLIERGVEARRVSLVDILPTVLELQEVPHGWREFDGAALFTKQEDGVRFQPSTKTYVAELLVQHRSLLRAVIEDEWKYIAARKWLTPRQRSFVVKHQTAQIRKYQDEAIDIWGSIVHEELYDLEGDPGEARDLVDEYPDHKAKLAQTLGDYEDYARRKLQNGSRGPHTIESLSPEERAGLEELGYSGDGYD